jgi:hypothetical protein
MISCKKGLDEASQIFTGKVDTNILQKFNSYLKENKQYNDYSVKWANGFY